jgi:hypothetical protein
VRATLALLLAFFALAFFIAPPSARAQDAAAAKRPDRTSNLADALTPAEWARVDRGIERALAWLATQQQPDGSFLTRDGGQPAITSLGVMAFLSAGHLPSEGPYGEKINRAIDFVLSCQQPDGLICYLVPETYHAQQGASRTGTYNHAIAGLMLSEVYGQVSRERSEKIQVAVNEALKYTERFQRIPAKVDPRDQGGWRYIVPSGNSSSDLSVTGWHLMFLRSAKNAQFEIPDAEIAAALRYVETLFQPARGEFFYGHIGSNDRYTNRGMMGVGALSLSLAGKHNTDMARKAGDYLLARPFDVYGATFTRYDRFHYSAYYCSNAMAQLGGDYWKQFFPTLAKTLLDAQAPDGSWLSESGEDGIYGPAYPTSLSVLTLTPAYQLLPIYQR